MIDYNFFLIVNMNYSALMQKTVIF